MINNLYNRYFQKSRSFLYPALGFKKYKSGIIYNPEQTYIAFEDKISIQDRKLICKFNIEKDDFTQFEEKYIYTHPLYLETIEKGIYVFNYTTYEGDWENFLKGKYSRFSEQLKNSIKIYYGEKSDEYKYIHSYLYPDKHYNIYSKLLDIDKSILEKNGELCDVFNIEKETLNISEKSLIIQE